MFGSYDINGQKKKKNQKRIKQSKCSPIQCLFCFFRQSVLGAFSVLVCIFHAFNSLSSLTHCLLYVFCIFVISLIARRTSK